MYINELSPAAGSTHVGKRKGRGHATGNGKTQDAATRVRRPAAAAAPIGLWKAARCPCPPYTQKRLQQHLRKAAGAINVSALEKFEDGAVVDARPF